MFTRAGYRNPLFMAIPTGIVVLIGAAVVGGLSGVNPLIILAVLLVIVLFVAEGNRNQNDNSPE